MGLFEDIEDVIKANGGKVSVEQIIGSLKTKYARDTVLEFLQANESDFSTKGASVSSYRYPVDYLRFLLDGYLLNTRMEGDVVFYSIAYFLFLKRQFPEIEIHQFADSYQVIKQRGFEQIQEPDFWKFSDRNLDMLLDLFNRYCLNVSVARFTDDEFYKLTSEYYEYFINRTALTRGLFSTPETLVRLISELIPDGQPLRVYNPAAGVLKLLTAINLKRRGDIYAVASEIHRETFDIGSLFAATNGFRLAFKNEDSIEELDQLGPNEFDLVVSVPPFNAKIHPRYGNYESYNDVALDIISTSLYKLRDSGKAIFLVVDGVLFSEAKNQKRFRKEIIESKMLHSVISLPGNLFYPHTAVKTSLLMFDKSQNQSSVRFIDASTKSFYSTTREKSISLDIEKIANLFDSDGDSSQDESGDDRFITKTSIVVDNAWLKKNDYSLSIQKYLMQDAQQLQNLGDVKLGKILKQLRLPLNQGYEIPYLRITDLNGSYIDDPKGLGKNQNRTRGRILDEKAILIGLVGGSSKPSLYNTNIAVEVSTNIAILKPDTDQVDLDYLLQELNSSYIKDQFEFMAIGSTSLRHLKVSDLLNVTIKLPTIDEQRRVVRERRQFLKEQQIRPADKRDGVSAGQVIKTLKHEIGNILAGPSGLLSLLPDFLEKNGIVLDTPSANYKTARSIGERIASASSDITKVNQIMGTMEGILLAESSSFNPENTEILSYLRKRFEKLSEHQSFSFNIGGNSQYQTPGHIYAEIDKLQFDHLVDNIIINAVEHSDAADGKLRLVVNVVVVESEKSKDIEIHFMNNGRKLPSEFSIDDYIGFSIKTGASKGQGIGGFLVDRIAKNHYGNINLLPPSSFKFKSKDGEIDFKSNFEIVVTIPQKQ